MSQRFCLHQLSAQKQHAAVEQAQAAVTCMLRRLERLSPLIQNKLVEVLYDRGLEGQSLETSNRNFLGLVNTLSPDYRRRWFIAVKNYATPSESERIDVSVKDIPDRVAQVDGLAPNDFISEHHSWLSFVGTPVFDCARVEISYEEVRRQVEVGNYCDEASLVRSWPVYEASPKHRLEEYQRNGLRVSAMDLSSPDAQAALTIALEIDGSRYAVVRGKIYRFLPTNSGHVPPTFHGFRVRTEDIPENVLKVLQTG